MSAYQPLFCEEELDRVLENLRAKAEAHIRGLTESQIAPEREGLLLKELKHQYVVNPLVLRTNQTTREGPRDVQIELSGERAFLYGRDHVVMRGIEVTFIVPFDGDSWLFKCRPNTWSTLYPIGEIIGQEYHLILRNIDKNPETVKQERDRQLQEVAKYIRWQQPQIDAYNQQILPIINNGLEQRRQGVKHFATVFADALGVPARRNEVNKANQEVKKIHQPKSSGPGARKPKVFICYSKEDHPAAKVVSEQLREAGIDSWLDKESLVGGDNWESEIKNAVARSDAFIACLRPGFDEIGFRQQEVRWAIEALKLRPPGKGYIIPYIIEPCELPEWCTAIHAGSDLTKPSTIDYLLRAIEKHCNWTRKAATDS